MRATVAHLHVRADRRGSGLAKLRWGSKRALVILRQVLVAIVGSLVLAAGIVMSVSPGPGVLVLLLGLSILATEFPWARKMLTRFKAKIRSLRRRWEMTRRPDRQLQ